MLYYLNIENSKFCISDSDASGVLLLFHFLFYDHKFCDKSYIKNYFVVDKYLEILL